MGAHGRSSRNPQLLGDCLKPGRVIQALLLQVGPQPRLLSASVLNSIEAPLNPKLPTIKLSERP